MSVLERADGLAVGAERPDLAALCLNYLAIARVEVGDLGGLETMRAGIALAVAGGHSEPTARGYTKLAELLMRVGRLDEHRRRPRLHPRARLLVTRLPLPAAAAPRRLGRRRARPARAGGDRRG